MRNVSSSILLVCSLPFAGFLLLPMVSPLPFSVSWPPVVSQSERWQRGSRHRTEALEAEPRRAGMNGACADKPRKSVGVRYVCNCTFNPPHDAPRKLSLNIRKEEELAGSQG